MQFEYPVVRRHIILLASLHHTASTVMVLMAQILVTARNFRWRGKSRSGPQTRCHFWRLSVHYQAQYPVDFSRSFFSVLKSSNTTTSSSQTTRPPRRSVYCQVSLVKLVGDQDKHPQLLKIITPTVQPAAEPQGAEPSSSSALSSTDLPTSSSSSERPPRRTTSPSARSSRQGSRSKSRSHVGNTTATRDSSPSDPDVPTSVDGCSSQILGRKKSHSCHKK